MYYTQKLSDFDAIINTQNDAIRTAFDALKSDYNHQKLPFMHHIFHDNICVTADNFAQSVRKKRTFKHLVILGTGGSALGTNAVASWNSHFLRADMAGDVPKLHILDNFDPATHHDFFAHLPINDAYFVIISKSGGTLETMSQAFLLQEYFVHHNMLDKISDYVCVVTENKDSPLKRFAKKYNLSCFDHDDKIGGRYSVLTMTGLLPIFLLGYDGYALMNGAKSVVKSFENATTPENITAFSSAAALTYLHETKHFTAHICFSYGDRFYGLGLWLRQLIAESLGKDNKGMIFIPATGPVDQHSQLQLYADGINDKVYSVFTSTTRHKEITIHNHHDVDFEHIVGKTTFDIKTALQDGTLSSLRHLGRKIREIAIHDFTMETLGALMMDMMLETVICAKMMNIDAFNQPAVEDAKIRTKQLLKS